LKKTKDNIQQEGLILADKYPQIIYEFATGVGKTLLAILNIEKFGGNWFIIIAETTHKLNWVNEFKKHKKEHLLVNVTFLCYNSLHKYTDGENYIFDEIHHIQSPLRINLLQEIKTKNLKRFIGLSATLSKRQKELITESIGYYHVHKVTLSDAISNSILPEPIMYFIGIELNDIIKTSKYYFNKDKFITCTEKEYYTRISNRIESLKNRYFGTGTFYDKINWLKTANDRKKFIANCKTASARILLRKLESKKLICFTNSIEQSESLSKGLSIHSKLSKTTRECLLNDFNNNIITKLFATGMLREGVNLEGIEAGIIIQLDNQERMFSQITGRTLRALFPEQYVLYIKDTQDEVYVQTVLEGFNMNYVRFVNLDSI